VADSSVPVTAGVTGTIANIDTFAIAGGDHQQIVRMAKGTAEAENAWTISTTASTSQIAADATRLGILMVNMGSGRVYLRWDSTAPTATVCDWYLEAGDRYEVPEYLVTFAVSMLGQFAGGTVNSKLVTSA
jgi:hypothetical protein